MQSGRVLPSFRQIFSNLKTGSSTRDSNSQQGQGGSRERDATEEEARQAAELLSISEEFRKNNLKVSASNQQGKHVLLVTDGAGTLLRVIASAEIVRMLLMAGTPDASRQGRILDRRI